MERSFRLASAQSVDAKDVEQALLQIEKTHQPDPIDGLADKSLFFQSAFRTLLEFSNASKQLRDEAVSVALSEQMSLLRKNMSGLSTLAALSPMLGLLGTVVGLMVSFREIGLNKGPVDPAMVADGLWVALSTTAAGIFIAVFCVLFHASLSSSQRRKQETTANALNKLSLALAQIHDTEDQRQ